MGNVTLELDNPQQMKQLAVAHAQKCQMFARQLEEEATARAQAGEQPTLMDGAVVQLLDSVALILLQHASHQHRHEKPPEIIRPGMDRIRRVGL